MEIFTQGGGEMLSRWGHYLAGVTWIGLLYYFNFVQVPTFAQFEAGTRTEAIAKLAPRALRRFRWGAVLTLLTGLSILVFQENYDMDYFKTTPGMSILTGVVLALFMFGNVWLVIWPNQKVVIASAQRVLAGGEADPAAAGSARKGALASRTNTVFSIPMLFFMGATSHFASFAGFNPAPEGSDRAAYYVIALAIMLILELNALGVFGTSVGGPRVYLETHRDAIIAGFVLAAIYIVVFEVLFGL